MAAVILTLTSRKIICQQAGGPRSSRSGTQAFRPWQPSVPQFRWVRASKFAPSATRAILQSCRRTTTERLRFSRHEAALLADRLRLLGPRTTAFSRQDKFSSYTVSYSCTESQSSVKLKRNERSGFKPTWDNLTVILPVGDSRSVVRDDGKAAGEVGKDSRQRKMFEI